MPIDKYRFISPGVFTTEIDQSQRDNVDLLERGPIIIGRSRKGPAFEPVRVKSYEEFVRLFGEPVAGGGANDAWRNGGLGSPMYGTYAVEAYLRDNQPVTFMRLLGAVDPDWAGAQAGSNGWQVATGNATGGGAYALYAIPSGSLTYTTGTLAAVWYCGSGASITLSGTTNMSGAASLAINAGTASNAALLQMAGTSPTFKVVLSQSSTANSVKTFDFNRSSANYIRNVFNTDPTQLNSYLYASGEYDNYVLGPTYERAVASLSSSVGSMLGMVLKFISGSNAVNGGDFQGLYNSTDYGPPTAKTGWFLSQDLDNPTEGFLPQNSSKKLFRFHGLQQSGDDLQSKVKISIRDISYPTAQETNVNPWPSWTLQIRDIRDTDRAPRVLESFEGLNLNPTSPNFIAKVIGDKYAQYNTTERRMEEVGDYTNQSQYIRVQIHDDYKEGGGDLLMPFGVLGPPKFRDNKTVFLTQSTGGGGTACIGQMTATGQPQYWGEPSPIANHFQSAGDALTDSTKFLLASSSAEFEDADSDQVYLTTLTGGILLKYPAIPLVVSASTMMGANGQKNAYFGADLQETAGSKRLSPDIVDMLRVLPASLGDTSPSVDFQYAFTLDNIIQVGTGSNPTFVYQSGSRGTGTSITALSGASSVITGSEINKFTTVMYGGFDGLDITELNPFRNYILSGDGTYVNSDKYGTSEATNYALHSINRALNIIRDPELVDYNLAAMPGITNEGLTDELIDICEDRGDALALIDIQNDYQPRAEGTPSTFPKLPNLTNAVNSWKGRSTDSSYGCAFFPWVQTRDRRTGQLVWIPPSIAALGTMGSSAARSELWFAPAGFNRGGLSQGSAGIPIVNVRKKLTSKNRDKLYENRINPIASFPAEGIVIFGQKTCQIAETALDRINVRRLLIFLKKQISFVANTILFDQNVPATWARFKGQVDPLLSNVQTRFGLTDYKLILDETTTTPELIDRNIMYAKIYLKPARAIEYIALDFFISSTGASFED